MRPDDRDAAQLWDMLQAARDAELIARDLSFDDLVADRKTQLALAKAVELVGEAASRVSPPFRDSTPDVEWHPIIGMRNRLVHDYWRINFAILWDVVANEIPPLIRTLERLTPDPPQSK
jgi:uncharacterized protein with HEPN domain